MGMLIDVVKSLVDMKKLAGLQNAIEDEIKQLDADGKLPAELKTAFEALQNTSQQSGGKIEDAMKPLQDFIAVLEKYEDLFPDNIKNIISKFESVEKDLESAAGDIESKTEAK